MNKFTDVIRAADRFVSEVFGVVTVHDTPDGQCPGSPHALALGPCGKVGPHGAHPVDDEPTYST